MVLDVGVAAPGLPYETWTAIAGTTVWGKVLLDFALPRHAQGFGRRAGS